MNNPNPRYVLKINEMAWTPKKNARQISFIKTTLRVVLGVLVVGSLVFGDNLFSELSFFAKATLIAFFLGTWFVSPREKAPKPLEVRFYDDYLVMYRQNRYYNPRLSRMEFDKFLYKDIEKILYRPETQRLNIYGMVEGKWYNYRKDGSLPGKPSYHKTTDSFSYFYIDETSDVDLVAVFERYTPITVTIEKN